VAAAAPGWLAPAPEVGVNPRTLLGRVLLVGLLWLLGGGIGLLAGVAFVVYDLVSRPAPRDLLVLAVLLLGLVPLVVLAGGLPAVEEVGPGFVEGNLAAHYLAGAGLALLVVGVLREVRAGPPPPEPPAQAEPPAHGVPAHGEASAHGRPPAGRGPRRQLPAPPARPGPPEERR
jgi:hypothetical protein